MDQFQSMEGAVPVAPPVVVAERAPKRAQTAYFVFLNANRQKVLAEKPEWTVREVVSELGARWRAMDAEAKKPFEDIAREDKIRADQEKSAWIAAGNEMPARRKKKKHKKKKKRINDGTHVKRAVSAYIFFLIKNQPAVKSANPTYKVGQVAQEIGKMWRAMNDEQKGPYVAMQADDQERHRTEMEAKIAAQKQMEEENQAQQQANQMQQQVQQQVQQQQQQQMQQQVQQQQQQQQVQQMQQQQGQQMQQPMQGQPMQGQPMQGQQMQGQPMQGQPMQTQPMPPAYA